MRKRKSQYLESQAIEYHSYGLSYKLESTSKQTPYKIKKEIIDYESLLTKLFAQYFSCKAPEWRIIEHKEISNKGVRLAVVKVEYKSYKETEYEIEKFYFDITECIKRI